ncbi:MAG: hypothetical protein EBU90_24290 [Proteobacteria bacterium]|nr:hypothetical protein [Pseudomonadota bacterium]
MKKNITLYNNFHKGDLFYSRILVNILSKNFNITYYHNQGALLFDDLPYVNEILGIPGYDLSSTYLEQNIVNTWIGQKNMHYVNNQIIPGCSFDNHFKLVKDICDYYQIMLNESIKNYLPIILYENLKEYDNIVNEMIKLKKQYKKLILISNGDVLSGQAQNFDFSPIVIDLASNNKNCLFLVTKKINTDITNIIDISENVTKLTSDMLQISLVSNYCDIIVGRASGPFCFTHTKNNFNDPTKTFISFTNIQSEGIFYFNGENKNIWSNNYEYNNIIKTIQDEINLKLLNI